MEILTRLFPYTKTVAGLKTALTQVLRFREPTAESGRNATHLPSVNIHRESQTIHGHLRIPFTWSVLKQRRSSRGLFTAQLAGIVFQIMSVTVADELSLISRPTSALSKCDGLTESSLKTYRVIAKEIQTNFLSFVKF